MMIHFDEPSGTKTWRDAEELLHRDDGPAFVKWRTQVNGVVVCEQWYYHGNLHRLDGPAFQHLVNGQPFYASWWLNGKLHRDGGPAKTGVRGQEWFQHGKIHRDDGPAWEFPSGSRAWYRHGLLHREDGPAKITLDRWDRPPREEWWVGGRRHRVDGPAVVAWNETSWWQRGKLHRDDGPALEKTDGTKKWYKRGRLHGDDGPAVIFPAGSREFWRHGQLHRQDGPAVEVAEGYLVTHASPARFRQSAMEVRFQPHLLSTPQPVHQGVEYWAAGKQYAPLDFLARLAKRQKYKKI